MVTWQLTIDANDPTRLVRFWAPALGYELQPPPEGFDSWVDWYRSVGVPEEELEGEEFLDRIQDPNGEGPTIWFQLVPERKTIKNRLHLDLYPSGRDRTLTREQRRERVEPKVTELVAAGATVLRRFPDDFEVSEDEHPTGYYVVMADPEGNEFCVA